LGAALKEALRAGNQGGRNMGGGKGQKRCANLAAGRKIYVGNLPRDVQDEKLREAIARKCEKAYGLVDYVHVAALDESKKESRFEGKLHEGYAFVRFKDEDAARKAHDQLSDSGVLAFEGQSRPLRVEWAREIHEEDIDQEAVKASEDRRRARNEHKRRQRRRNKEIEVDELQGILNGIPAPAGLQAGTLFRDLEESSLFGRASGLACRSIEWADVPKECDPGAIEWYSSKVKEHVERRRQRKRCQVESFALILSKLVEQARRKTTRERIKVVDFGSGSGGLCLPLAFLFPDIDFHAVDMKSRAIELLLEKAHKAGLTNVTASAQMIEQYVGDFDVGLALHACGNATDYAMLRCVSRKAAFALCPCCVGKLKFSLEGGSSFSSVFKSYKHLPANESEADLALSHPRSEWMRRVVSKEGFALIAKAGDISHGAEQDNHGQNHGYDSLARVCKANVEYDRCQSAQESGYNVGLFKLINAGSTAKAELITGVPATWQDVTF